MKREIIFRGIRIDNGEWVYGYLFNSWFMVDPENTDEMISKPYIQSGKISFEVIPETIGQFVGINDKNGVMIFEGDLLEYYEFPVTYQDGGFCVTMAYDLTRLWLNSEDCNLDELKVVGNIHNQQL